MLALMRLSPTLYRLDAIVATDSTRTAPAVHTSRASRMDKAQRAAQARLADKSFSAFMRAHNRQIGGQR